jgi:hypothetical protein
MAIIANNAGKRDGSAKPLDWQICQLTAPVLDLQNLFGSHKG